MSKVITDENQLNTEVDDLITEDYALEVLGLKNPADFRKFSRSFMKLSKIVKEINDSNNNKLDKDGYNGTAKNLNDELSKKATKTQLGRIIVGDNLTIDNNGKLNGTPPVDITGKFDKGSVPEKYNTAEKIANELDKKASATELGRVKIGQNLSITADGVLNGNPAYTHPTGNGYSHLPVNGATGQFIKYASAGNGQWSQITWNDITEKPSTFPPTAHTQDWSTITGKPSSFIPNAHTHDDRYYTENEVNNLLNRKSNTGHNHDSIYLNKNVIGAVNSIETLNNATETGIYAVNGYEINGLYGWGFLYVTKNGGTINQYYVSHVGGTCYRQDWNGNIANGKWITQWDNNNFNPNDKANSNHSHTAGQVGAYTKGEIDTKFKNLNLVPVPVSGILLMYNTSNPAELYSGTTWELLATDKYLKTTTGTPLSTGGSNSFTISKANLPAIKIQLESFSVTTQPHTHPIYGGEGRNGIAGFVADYLQSRSTTGYKLCDTQNGGGANTGTASPYTQNLGSGTAISINPTYITIRAWKRLS